METVEHFERMIKPQPEKAPRYKVVRVYANSGRKITLQRNLFLDEAQRIVKAFPNCLNSMVVYYKQ